MSISQAMTNQANPTQVTKKASHKGIEIEPTNQAPVHLIEADFPIMDEIIAEVGSPLPMEKASYFESLAMGEIKLVSTTGADQTNNTRSETTQQEKKQTLSLSFTAYIETIKKLRIYQSTNDAAGFNQWIKIAGVNARLLVTLRKLSSSIKPEDTLRWQRKYTELANRENCSYKQVANFHQHIFCFDEMRNVIAQFSQNVQRRPQPIPQTLQIIWPNLIKILNGQWSENIIFPPLEQALHEKIKDAKLRQVIMGLLKPLMTRACMIADKRHLSS